MRANPQHAAVLVTFTEEILNRKLDFLCSGITKFCKQALAHCYKLLSC